MNTPSPRRPPRRATADLLVLTQAEQLATALLTRTMRWPKNIRQSLTRRLEDQILDVVDDLVIARYHKPGRADRLATANLRLERARFLLRIAHDSHHCPANHYEATARQIDDVGRLLYGWRQTLAGTSS